MSSIARISILLLVAFVLTACATATPYQPLKNGYGYKSEQIEGDRYRVSFRGNAATPRDTVENYLLYRAASITLAEGYDYFVIARQDTQRDTSYYNLSTMGPAYPDYPPFFYGPYYNGPTYAQTMISRPIDRYRADATIVLKHGKKPSNNVHAYSAKAVSHHLKPRITQSSGEEEKAR